MQNTVGKLLKNARKKKGLSLEEVEKETRIRLKNLKAIESEKWGEFTSRIYIQGVITSYGKYLGLDNSKLLAYFRREYEQHEQMKFKTKATKDQFTPQTKRVLRIAVITVFLIFVSYFGYQLSLLSLPPTVEILEPTKTMFVKEKKVLLRGLTKKETTVLVNEERVFLNEENIFETEVPLTKKENKVIIEATGANGKTRTIELLLEKQFEE